jgi:hypothetical protein
MEGFLQSLKFKNKAMQEYVCTLTGYAAKRAGKHKKWWEARALWWRGKKYKRDSDAYQDLLDRAFNRLYTTNKKAKRALLASKGSILRHSIGGKKPARTILTESEFCSRLMNIREALLLEE